MKYFISATIFIFCIFAASITGAQKLYTWTDENGNLHITQEPPPKSAKVEDVVKVGDEIEVCIQKLDRKKRRIDLTIASEEDDDASEIADDEEADHHGVMKNSGGAWSGKNSVRKTGRPGKRRKRLKKTPRD